MTTVSVRKNLPSSSYYSGSGDTTITLAGVTEIIFNSKKSLTKIRRPRSKSRQASNPSDVPDNRVIDLQRLEETMVIRGWLEDDSTETAWNKAWKLRAMCSRGGPLTSLTVGNIVFPTGTSPNYTVPQAFLEEVSFTIKPDDTGSITTSKIDIARIEVSLSFYFGNER